MKKLVVLTVVLSLVAPMAAQAAASRKVSQQIFNHEFLLRLEAACKSRHSHVAKIECDMLNGKCVVTCTAPSREM